MANSDIQALNNAISAHTAIQEEFNANCYDSLLFARFTNNDAFIANTDSGYNPISINVDSTHKNVYTKGGKIAQPDPSVLVFDIPDSYEYVEGLVIFRPKIVTAPENVYVQAVWLGGENYGSRSVLASSIGYQEEHGFDHPLQFYNQNRNATNQDPHHRIAIEVNGAKTFDYLTIMLKAHQYPFM